MLDTETTFCFFDFTDPASYIIAHVLRGQRVDWRGFELRTPPTAPIDPRDPEWMAYQEDMGRFAEALDVEMSTPRLIPWTRKAHELAIHARERDCSEAVRDALFRAHFVEGRDIGRIDVLVEIGASRSLDRGEVKAVLDVDRHHEAVSSDRALGQELGVIGAPTLVRGEQRLEGLRSPGELLEWTRGI